jgi:hypothetical protein
VQQELQRSARSHAADILHVVSSCLPCAVPAACCTWRFLSASLCFQCGLRGLRRGTSEHSAARLNAAVTHACTNTEACFRKCPCAADICVPLVAACCIPGSVLSVPALQHTADPAAGACAQTSKCKKDIARRQRLVQYSLAPQAVLCPGQAERASTGVDRGSKPEPVRQRPGMGRPPGCRSGHRCPFGLWHDMAVLAAVQSLQSRWLWGKNSASFTNYVSAATLQPAGSPACPGSASGPPMHCLMFAAIAAGP